MLGKDYDRKRKREALDGGRGSIAMVKPRPFTPREAQGGDDSEEEAGRSSLGKSKQVKGREKAAVVKHAADGLEERGTSLQGLAQETAEPPPPKTGTYLDEVLIEQARKRKKKNKKKKNKKKNRHEGPSNVD